MAAPPSRAVSVSTAARTPGTRKANWTNQVSSTRSRLVGSANLTGGSGVWGACTGCQNCQPGGGAGQSGGGVQPAHGTQPGDGSGHPGGGRHTMPVVVIGALLHSCEQCSVPTETSPWGDQMGLDPALETGGYDRMGLASSAEDRLAEWSKADSRGHAQPPEKRKASTAVKYRNEHGLTGTSVHVCGRSDLPEPCTSAYVL